MKTETIFKAQEITSEEDFIKLVALAYSWMPTIPAWRRDLNWKECKAALKRFRSGAAGSLKEMLELIVPSINNSIVGASKVLHFVSPDRATIIDSNVVIGWRTLFFPTGTRKRNKTGATALPSDFGSYGENHQKRERHIDLYVGYAENLAEWVKNLHHVSAREYRGETLLARDTDIR